MPIWARHAERLWTKAHAQADKIYEQITGDAHPPEPGMQSDAQTQRLFSGRCAAAAFYPREQVRPILRGIHDTLESHKLMQNDVENNRRAVMAMAISVSGVNAASKEKSGKLGVSGITNLMVAC